MGVPVKRQSKGSMRWGRRFRRFFRHRVYRSGNTLYLSEWWPRRFSIQPLGLQPFFDGKRHGARFYSTPLGWLLGPLYLKRHPSVLLAPEPFGRLGNQTIQLVHAIAMAKRFRVQRIVAPMNSLLPPERSVLPSGCQVDANVAATNPVRLRDLFAKKWDWLARDSHIVMNTYFSRELVTTLSPAEYDEAFSELRAVAPLAESAKALPASHLVIHLRGGDAFGPQAHPDYAQPPLAFYRLVLGSRKWRKVTIVRADASHPFERTLIHEIEQSGVPVGIQSGSAEEDAVFLARARSLVSSRGSFVPAIVGRSIHCSDLFVFGDEKRLRGGMTVHRIVDTKGEFWQSCCQRNWRDSVEQRELMRDYEVGNLTLERENR